ncbi:bicyclomycin resistance protein [Marinobacter lipolyticus SM19]|uniref:Bicyclomycin resistance protein n=1 Tax=Marinobacter lipolyticus SM19 TaxID=1318628 RepID=R8B3M0_9GAMM|nr:MFS transporter [Marinobacter lipolyticus]EON93187.1 bicyclomycin resistance protein [Marinobacter lipolyticus SM19]
MPQIQLAILLGMTVALGPLALDAYLPAFPDISDGLGASDGQIGLTLSAYVGALGLAQLVGGPLSDRYGRQQVLLGGLSIFGAAALMVAHADTIGQMLFWRVVQGIGGAFCAVSVTAIVRDQSQGSEAARLFGLIGLIMFIAPALAPSIGSLLLTISDWPAIFLMLTGYAMVLAVILHFALFRRLQALCFSAMLVFITHASFIYQEWFGLSKAMFSGLFAANIGAMACVNLLNRRLLNRFESVDILRMSVLLQTIAIIALVLCAWAAAPYWAVAACIIVAVAFMGAIVPNNMANALEFFPHLGGTAAALLGAAQFTIAGAISAISATLSGGSLLPIVLTMAVCVSGAAVLAAGAPRAVRRELALSR